MANSVIDAADTNSVGVVAGGVCHAKTGTTMAARSASFDIARGMCALVVCFGHVRNLLLKDYNDTGPHDVSQQLFYFLTGLGHQAVMVFFVMSGWLVGGVAWRSIGGSNWSWGRYLLARLTRLWIVLIPALILTLFWDSLGGVVFFSSPPYVISEFAHVIPRDFQEHHGFVEFVGNVVFIQNHVAVYGSNGPLWSLAYEFAYYLLFPLLVCGVRTRGAAPRAMLFTAALVIGAIAGLTILAYGSIWIMGVAAASVGGGGKLSKWVTSRWFTICSAMAVLLASVLPQILSDWPLIWLDIVLGASVALALLSLRERKMPCWVRSVSRYISEISYSLYVVHLPFAVFLCAWLLNANRERLDWSWGAVGLVVGVAICAVAYSAVCYHLFERHTNGLRKWVGGVARSRIAAMERYTS